MNKKPIAVVTGGAGFIGSHMVDLLLAENYEVRVIDSLIGGRESNLAHHANNPNLTCEWRDIRTLTSDHRLFSQAEAVFHFAGIGDIVPSIEQPSEYFDTNVQGTIRVLECARSSKVGKFVYAASSSCYGLASVPTREDHPIAPQYPYALSKYMGEQATFHWHQVYRLPVNSIRIFNAYGPRVRTTGAYGAVFGVFFKQKLEGKPFTVVGDGTQTRDFLYVTDVAAAFFRAAKTDKIGQIYNLGAGNPQSVNSLVQLLSQHELNKDEVSKCELSKDRVSKSGLGKDGVGKGTLGKEVVYVPKRPGEPDCTYANIEKITRELNWKPTVSFETGVKNMLEDIECWRDAPLWDPSSISKATKTWFDYLGESDGFSAVRTVETV